MFTKRENEETALFVIRWAARLLGLMVLFLLFLFYMSEGGPTSDVTWHELVGLIFFPVGLGLGFIVGWKHELAGGLISVLSVAGFYVIYGLLLSGSIRQGWWFLVFALPGFLYLLYGLLNPLWFARSSGHVHV